MYTDSQDVLVLSTLASRYCNCCTDGSTRPGNYYYFLVFFTPVCTAVLLDARARNWQPSCWNIAEINNEFHFTCSSVPVLYLAVILIHINQQRNIDHWLELGHDPIPRAMKWAGIATISGRICVIHISWKMSSHITESKNCILIDDLYLRVYSNTKTV
jgi:hypothetical protein